MSKSKRYSVPYRRAREGRTNYKTRLDMLKGDQPRLIVRRSLKQITIQAVYYEPAGDKVACTTSSNELKKLGWKHSTGNTPSAYLTGLLAGQKLKQLKITKLVLDLGLHAPVKGSRIFAALKGVVDSGVEIPHAKEVLPSEERLTGKHISEHVKSASTIVADTEALKNKING